MVRGGRERSACAFLNVVFATCGRLERTATCHAHASFVFIAIMWRVGVACVVARWACDVTMGVLSGLLVLHCTCTPQPSHYDRDETRQSGGDVKYMYADVFINSNPF